MARTTTTQVTVTDDLTGRVIEGDAMEVCIIINGAGVTLDLSPESLARFEQAVAKFMKDREPKPMRVTQGTQRKASAATYEPGFLAAVRDWAREQGHSVYDKGIPKKEFIDGYKASLEA